MLRLQDSYALARLRRRLGRRPEGVLEQPPEHPNGVKLELTYACNLRCGFCYTDSPRRTLQRSIDLPDEDWRRITAEAIELGVIEAVVTGGEPLLRKELTLSLVETLASAEVGVTLNTNGWFVDDEVAARMRGLPVSAFISIDGARPGLHDGQRGVPGSWRRAIEGVDRLLGVGVDICVIHVVTPENANAVPEFLEQMWVLGVPRVTLTPVVETGAAARRGNWRVSSRHIHRAAARFEARRGSAMRIRVRPGNAEGIAHQGRQAPASMLVRPNGDVRTDSLRPFSFGNAAREGVESCWEAIRAGWRDPRIEGWAGSLRGPRDLADADLVSYLDEEVHLEPGGEESEASTSGRELPVPQPAPLPPIDPETDLAQAREKVLALALARRYRQLPLKFNEDANRRFIRRPVDGGYLVVNGSSAAALDAFEDGTLADAAAALQARYGIDSSRAAEDANAALRALVRHRIVVPAGAPDNVPGGQSPTSDLPDLSLTGEAGSLTAASASSRSW